MFYSATEWYKMLIITFFVQSTGILEKRAINGFVCTFSYIIHLKLITKCTKKMAVITHLGSNIDNIWKTSCCACLFLMKFGIVIILTPPS
jgi:hypothetical protein